MEVIFGVQATDRTLRVQLDEEQVAHVRRSLEEAFATGEPGRLLWVTDRDGVELAIPLDKLAFVEFGVERGSKQVGFSAAS